MVLLLRSTPILMACFALSIAGSLTAAHGEPLEDELTVLLTAHPQVQAGMKAVLAAEEAITKAGAGYLPKAVVSADSGIETINNPDRRARGANGDQNVWTRGRHTYNLSVKQPIYSGGETDALTASARLQREVAEFTLASTRQTVMQEGIAAYINVLRQARLVELAVSNESTIKRQFKLEDERVKRGSGITVDVLQAKSRLQLAKERRVALEGALNDAITRYTQVFDHAPDIATMSLPKPPLDLLPDSSEAAVAIATEENLTIASADRQVEIAREKREAARAGFYPTLELDFEHNFEKDKNTVVGIRRDSSLLLRLKFDLFSGFTTTSSVAQAAQEFGSSQDTSLQTKRKVIESTGLAWQALLTTRKRMYLLENAMNIASEVFDARKKLREAGKENVINVLDSENEFYSARINFTGAAFDARVATYTLLVAMGRLTLDNIVAAAGGDELPLAIPVSDDMPTELHIPPLREEPPIPVFEIPDGPVAPPGTVPGETEPQTPTSPENPFDNPFDAPMPN